MIPLAHNVMLLLFLLAAFTTLWRWRYRSNGVQASRFIIFACGVVFYVWIQTSSYDALLGRWAVRALFVAWLTPEILENVDIIREEKTQGRSG